MTFKGIWVSCCRVHTVPSPRLGLLWVPAFGWSLGEWVARCGPCEECGRGSRIEELQVAVACLDWALSRILWHSWTTPPTKPWVSWWAPEAHWSFRHSWLLPQRLQDQLSSKLPPLESVHSLYLSDPCSDHWFLPCVWARSFSGPSCRSRTWSSLLSWCSHTQVS